MADPILLSHTEAALAALISAASVGTDNIYTGSNSDDKAAPCVICVATGADEDYPPGTGNKWVAAEIRVKSILAVDADGTNPETAAAALAGDVFNAVSTNTLATDLNALDLDFTCMGVIFDGLLSEQDEDCTVETLRLRLYCCSSALAVS